MAIETPWAVFPYIIPNPSFNEPTPPPTTPPDVGPFVCAHIPVAWLLVVNGALKQLAIPATWDVVTEAALDVVMHQVDALLGSIANASECMEMGSLTLTILAGHSDVSGVVTFPFPFSAVPVVVQSSDSEVLIASSQSISASGFVATLTAATPVLVDTAALFSWIAGPSS